MLKSPCILILLASSRSKSWQHLLQVVVPGDAVLQLPEKGQASCF